MKRRAARRILLWGVAACVMAVCTLVIASEETEEMIDIDWESPQSVYDRIMGQGPVEVSYPLRWMITVFDSPARRAC